MAVQWAASVFDREEAQMRLERMARGSALSLRRLFSRAPLRSRLELIFLPCRQVLLSATEDESSGFVLVNGFAKQAQQVRAGIPTVDDIADLKGYQYPLAESETLEIARHAFISWKLNRVSGRQKDSADFVVGDFVHYPFWARYAESRSGRVSLDLLDAVAGRPGGVMMKQAYLEAMKDGAAIRA